MHDGFYDILWPSETITNEVFSIATLISKSNQINLGKIEIAIREDVKANMVGLKPLSEILEKTCGYFDDEKYFFWIAYNDTYFISGYSTNSINNLDNLDISKINFKINENNPLNFLENIKINYMNFIRNTKYVYYEIKSNKKIFHGVLNLQLNQIMFNIDESLTDFKPLSNNIMLAITKTSSFKICLLTDNNGECIDKCSSNYKLNFNSEKGNYCSLECEKYIINHLDNICINECDEKIYTIKDKICGYCKDLNTSYPYKIINEK